MGGGLPTGGQGSKVYVLCAEPKEHKRFRPGTQLGGIGFPAGRIGDQGDREIVYAPNVYVPFPAPNTPSAGHCSDTLPVWMVMKVASNISSSLEQL